MTKQARDAAASLLEAAELDDERRFNRYVGVLVFGISGALILLFGYATVALVL